MPIETCPSAADWRQWSDGLLDAERSSDFEAHLADCDSCLAQVRNVDVNDVLLKSLTSRPNLTPEQKNSIARILERVKLEQGEADSNVFDPKTAGVPLIDETFVGDKLSSQVIGTPLTGTLDSVLPQSPSSVSSPSASIELEPVSQASSSRSPSSGPATQRDSQLATPSEQELIPGLVLGAYKLIKKLGQGGMGMVFLAEHQRMERLVALKVLPPSVTRNPNAVQRFHREVKAMARLSHPNVVTAYDADEARGLHFLVMEYVDGQDLSVLVKKRGPLPVDQAVDYIVQGARGLEYAHKRGLVHRDIKPSNFLVDTEGQVKILDLGLARFTEQTDHPDGEGPPGMDLTGTGVVVGTVDYMSPEQAEDTKRADARADIYSLGCSLFYLISGRSMFGGDTVVARLMAHQNQPIPSLKSINPAVPEELERIHRKMVAKKKDERYQTATELLEELRKLAPEAFAGQGPRFAPDAAAPVNNDQTIVGALSGSVTGGSTAMGASSPVTASLSAGAARPPARMKLLIGAAAAALAVFLGWLIIFRDKDGKEVGRVEGTGPVVVKTKDGTSAELRITEDGVKTVATPADGSSHSGWYGWASDAPKPAIAPFDAAQAKKHQEEWAAYLKLPVEYTNSIGMKFRLIPPGEFTMGSSKAEIDNALAKVPGDKIWQEKIQSEAPQHQVVLTQPFYMGVHEVTQSQYATISGDNPSSYAETSGVVWTRTLVSEITTKVCPVETVTWDDSAEFCKNLSNRELLEQVPFSSDADLGYRLPSEAEWEFSCRAGTNTTFSTGDSEESLLSSAWIETNSRKQTHPVGELLGNPFGLFDMHGNVMEWVQDTHEPMAYWKFRGQKAINPKGGTSGKERCIRGGDMKTAWRSRSRSRNYASASDYSAHHIGFRVALSVDAVKHALKGPQGSIWHGWPADAPKPAVAPFDAAQAKKHQDEWAAYLKVPVEYTNSIGMKFRLIPPGEFLMGSTPEEIEAARKESDPNDANWQKFLQSEGLRHKVVHPQPMYLGMTEVTQAEYARVMGNNPSHFAATGAGKEAVAGRDTTAHPVDSVGWYDAAEFCIRLSKQESLNPHYVGTSDSMRAQKGNGYRLPREAEWEFACRAGTTTRRWVGDNDAELARAGWFSGNSGGRTHAAGELKPNPFGLLDIQGNVWEWVEDIWDEKAYQGPSLNATAVSPSTSVTGGYPRVFRGGSFLDAAPLCRSALRFSNPPTDRGKNFGFRVAMSVAAVSEPPVARAPSSRWKAWPADAPAPAVVPFDAAQAKAHQEAWATYLKVPAEYTNAIGMKFRLIPPGEFSMGSTPEEVEAALKEAPADDKHWQECVKSEAPQHKVILPLPTYLGVNEITQAEYEKVMGMNPSHFASTGMGKEAVAGLDTASCPVESVSWNDAAEFCAKLSQQQKMRPYYFRAGETVTLLDGTGYRLITEAEWEFSCRAGTITKFWCGDSDKSLKDAGWFAANAGGRTHAVGELRANPFGLRDVHGNVWEWVEDSWGADDYGQRSQSPAINPIKSIVGESYRAYRGGYCVDRANNCISSRRIAEDPRGRGLYLGFRVSLSVDAVRVALAHQ